jgi:8-oxo-dGTP pyrophosphatase MutT (NUDIX family)
MLTEEALVREVKEEVSLDIKIGHILYVHTNLGGLPDRQTFQMIFSCEWVAGEIKLDPQEHSEHRWIFEGELEQFQMIEFLGKYHAWASKRI